MPEEDDDCYLRIPEFVYKGVRFSDCEISPTLRYDTRTPAHRACDNAITLAELATLHELATVAAYASRIPDVPEKAIEAGMMIHKNISNRKGVGEWTNDACDYDNRRAQRGVLTPDDYLHVRWVKHPVFERREGGWTASLQESSEELYVDLPPAGFVVLTMDGLYRPDTGTPFATEHYPGRVIRQLQEVGLEGEEYLSFFLPQSRGRGTYAVCRWSLADSLGPFSVFVLDSPDLCIDRLGVRSVRYNTGPTR